VFEGLEKNPEAASHIVRHNLFKVGWRGAAF